MSRIDHARHNQRIRAIRDEKALAEHNRHEQGPECKRCGHWRILHEIIGTAEYEKGCHADIYWRGRETRCPCREYTPPV